MLRPRQCCSNFQPSQGSSDDVELATTVVDRHITSFTSILTIGEELIHKVGNGKAALFEDASLSVLTEYNIFRDQSRS